MSPSYCRFWPSPIVNSPLLQWALPVSHGIGRSSANGSGALEKEEVGFFSTNGRQHCRKRRRSDFFRPMGGSIFRKGGGWIFFNESHGRLNEMANNS
jgi:hypothetical protein